MFICNFKLNFKKILIFTVILAVIIALFFEISDFVQSKNTTSYDYVLTESNFTDILKTVHDNIDDNVGKTIKLSGFVFRLPDFEPGYFVCGRDMLLDNEEKVVGFLSFYQGDTKLVDSEWIEVTGTFTKGTYMTDMPVIQVETVKKISAPANTYVKTPDYLK